MFQGNLPLHKTSGLFESCRTREVCIRQVRYIEDHHASARQHHQSALERTRHNGHESDAHVLEVQGLENKGIVARFGHVSYYSAFEKDSHIMDFIQISRNSEIRLYIPYKKLYTFRENKYIITSIQL